MGLLDRRARLLPGEDHLTIVAFFAVWALSVMAGNSWATLAVAPLVGMTFTQLGFIGHDAGHNPVFGTRRRNRLLGLTVANALIGLSFGWWVPKHNAHHAHPNEMGRAPTSAKEPPWPRLTRRERVRPVHIAAGTLAGAALLPPDAAAKQRHARTGDQAAAAATRPCRGGRGLSHHAARRAVPDGGAVGALPVQGTLAFVAVQQAVFSLYLGISFAPNHKGMPIIEAATAAGFARRQVIIARNISGGPFTTFMLGGLNRQIEHHLFPSMPRPNLRRVQGLVRNFCAATDLGYREESFAGSFRQIIHHLSDAGAAASRRPD